MTESTPRQRDLSISAADKLRCVEREVMLRHRTYPRLIAKGKLSSAQAAREIALMEAVAADMRAQAEAERML
jgi:hypothetical protein